jgi:AAA+ ATPase superfamily predicted ATPase
LNEASKEVLFIECKWKTLSMVESMRNLEKLKKKADFVKWNKGDRSEYYGIVAKKVEGKDTLRRKGFVVFDLDDL